MGIHRVIDISRYSTLSKLVGVTAYVLRFLSHLCKREPRNVGPLSAKERRLAFQGWIKNCQTLTYSDEIAILTSKSQSRLPLVRQLRLFLDSDGLFRCGGRIHNAPLDDSAKFPFLLPPRHPLSKLIIHDIHVKQLHSHGFGMFDGRSLVITLLDVHSRIQDGIETPCRLLDRSLLQLCLCDTYKINSNQIKCWILMDKMKVS